MTVKMEIGIAVATAPECYQNFIRANRDRIGIPLVKSVINTVLKEDNVNAVLRRRNKSEFNDGRLTSGGWYMDFKNQSELLAFKLKWS